MFKWFKTDPKSEAELKIEELIQLLFPPLVVEERGEHKFHVDNSADANLEAALIDLEEGHNDRVAQNTIRKIADRLFEARKILDAYNELDADAKYYVIDVTQDEATEDIRAADDV